MVATEPVSLTEMIFELAVMRVPATVRPMSPWEKVPAAPVSVAAVVATVMVAVIARLPCGALFDM